MTTSRDVVYADVLNFRREAGMPNPSTPLDELEISVRSHELLQKLGVEKLADIARLSREQILAAPTGTKLVVRELTELLAECGLELRE